MKFKSLLFLFISGMFLSSTPVLGSDTPNIKSGFIVAGMVVLHTNPKMDSKICATVYGHQTVEISEETQLWYKVTLKNGESGWLYKTDVALEPGPDTVLNSASVALIGYAKKFINTRYVYGGTTPKGFDCSGFTRFIYSRFGYRIPHCSQEQVNMGTPISRKRLLPADLVFFTTLGSTQINHVGIYIGEGKFIHASSGSRVVRIDALSQTYYKKRYQGARRVIRNYQSTAALSLR